jgi:hypothetical protein
MPRQVLHGLCGLGHRPHRAWKIVGPPMKISKLARHHGLTVAAGWYGLAALAVLQVVNELLPVVLGGGTVAAWNWGFVFVTVRFILGPLLAFSYIVGIVFLAVNRHRFESVDALRCMGAVLLGSAPFLWPMPLLTGR